MEDITFVVDHREHALIKEMRKRKLTVTIKSLDVGDIWIVSLHAPDIPHFIFERKTIDDLCASIVDGRFREQKHRLAETGVPVVYLLEGTSIEKKRVSEKSIRGSIVNIMHRDKMYVIRSNSVVDTVEYLQVFASRATHPTTVTTTGIRAPKCKRKRNEDTIYVRQLMCIPGISESIAQRISEVYPSISTLRDALLKDDTELKNIRIGCKRCLGPRLLERIRTSVLTS